MTDQPLTHNQLVHLALEVSVVADNQRVVADHIDRILERLPASEETTIIELAVTATLARKIFRALDTKAEALDALLGEPPPDDRHLDA